MLMVWEPGTSKNRSAPLSKQERISRNSERIFQPQKLLPQPGIKNLGGGLNKKYMFQIFFKSSLRIIFFQLEKQTTDHPTTEIMSKTDLVDPCRPSVSSFRIGAELVELRFLEGAGVFANLHMAASWQHRRMMRG